MLSLDDFETSYYLREIFLTVRVLLCRGLRQLVIDRARAAIPLLGFAREPRGLSLELGGLALFSERIALADFAVDVGGVWDAAAGRFELRATAGGSAKTASPLSAGAGATVNQDFAFP